MYLLALGVVVSETLAREEDKMQILVYFFSNVLIDQLIRMMKQNDYSKIMFHCLVKFFIF